MYSYAYGLHFPSHFRPRFVLRDIIWEQVHEILNLLMIKDTMSSER